MIHIPKPPFDIEICLRTNCSYLFGNLAAGIDRSCEADWASVGRQRIHIPAICPRNLRGNQAWYYKCVVARYSRANNLK